MSDDITKEESKPKKPRNLAKIGILITMLGLVVFVLTYGYGYLQLAKINAELANNVTKLQEAQVNDREVMKNIQQSLQTVSDNVTKNENLYVEQEKNLAKLRLIEEGDITRFRITEAQHLIKMANDTLQYDKDVLLAKNLLDEANTVLTQITDPNLLPVKKSLADDIVRLQSIDPISINDLYLKITALDKSIDQLPLPTSPLKDDNSNSDANNVATLPWWKRGLNATWHNLKQIVIVRKVDTKALPLVLPDETHNLYQNLHLQMQTVLWAVLNRNNTIYQASLNNIKTWVSTYFANGTQKDAMLSQLEKLQQVNVDPPNLNLSNTLQSIEAYLKQPT